MLENHKMTLVGHIKSVETNSILGSCIPCKKGNDLYIITCGHVLYNDDWSGLRHELIDLKVEVDSHIYKLVNILGTIENAKDTDLSIVQISKIDDETNLSFFELNLLEVKDNNYLANSKICVYPELDDRAQAIGDIKFAGNETDFQYSVEVDKSKFHNINLGAAGASQYKGVSGSGLFYEYNGELFLQGIVNKIPNISVNSEIDLVNVKAIKTIWENAIIKNSVDKSYPHLHHNSPFNSDTSRETLTRELLNQVSDKRYKVLVCAPSDTSSSSTAKNIFTQLIAKLNEEKINYSVGGGKEQLMTIGSYPHIEEREFIGSKECSTLVIIADDHSTFSQLSLLSSSIFNDHSNNIEVYIFYEGSVINSQSFIKNGPFKFAEERVRARAYEFSKFDDSVVSAVIAGIQSHHICLGKIA